MVGLFVQRRGGAPPPAAGDQPAHVHTVEHMKTTNTPLASIGPAALLTFVVAVVVLVACVLLVAPNMLRSCPLGSAPHPPRVLSQYNDLKYPLRTPDLAIDAIIRVYNSTTGDMEAKVTTQSASCPQGEVRVSAQLAGIVLCHRRDKLERLAIPGGFVEYGESVEDAVRREVLEETHIDLTGAVDRTGLRRHGALCRKQGEVPAANIPSLMQFRTFSHPRRDPRRHTVSVAFDVTAFDVVPVAADDVKECRVYSLSELQDRLHDRLKRQLFAFDHASILEAYIAEAFIEE